jgi:hypothetical protein
MTPDDNDIRRGKAIELFLADEHIRGAFATIEQQYFEEWKSSEDAGLREQLHARASGLDDLKVRLQALVDAGRIRMSATS